MNIITKSRLVVFTSAVFAGILLSFIMFCLLDGWDGTDYEQNITGLSMLFFISGIVLSFAISYSHTIKSTNSDSRTIRITKLVILALFFSLIIGSLENAINNDVLSIIIGMIFSFIAFICSAWIGSDTATQITYINNAKFEASA
jgi:hypothetical protein